MSVVGTAVEITTSQDVRYDENSREYLRRFLVETDTTNDGPITATTAPGLPLLYTSYQAGTEFDALSILRGFRANRKPDAPKIWEVEAVYRTPSDPNEKPDQNIFEPTTIDIDSETAQVIMWGTRDQTADDDTDDEIFPTIPRFKHPAVTSADEPFDPPHLVDESRPVVIITRSQDRFSLTDKVRFEDSVNIDNFMGAKPRQARITRITARTIHKLVNSQFISFWRVQYRIAFRRLTWDIELLNQGTFYYDGGYKNWGTGAALGGTKQHFVDDKGHPTTGLLGATGDKLADGADQVYARFRYYKENSFSELSLPQDVNQFINV